MCISGEKKSCPMSQHLPSNELCAALSMDWVQTNVLTDHLHFMLKNPSFVFFIWSSQILISVTLFLGRHPSLDSDFKWRRIYHYNQTQTLKTMSSFCSRWRCVLLEVQLPWPAWTDIFTLLTWTAHEREQGAKANSLSLPQPDHTLDSPSANIL